MVIIALFFLYFFRITGTGLLKEDEPRYAAIAREMARSGDWTTPRLWGEPWFEKPAFLYWMSGAGYRLGLRDELAPRLPVALLSILFLAFFYWTLRREFNSRAAWIATVILATSAGWLAYSYVAVPDLPLSAFFSCAMLLGLIWMHASDRRYLVAAAAALALAVLAKGLVPLALALPFLWHARSRWKQLLDWRAVATFIAVAAPWYTLCYLKNGFPFIQKLILEHHFGRFTSTDLLHPQPYWFYLPVFLAALFPWTPTVALLFRPSLYSDSRRTFLLLWLTFGLVFFSASLNKLPGYILPLLPAAAALIGIALAEARISARATLAASAALLCFIFPLASILPSALDVGLSRSTTPTWSILWMLPLVLAAVVWYLDQQRSAAVSLIGGSLTAAVIYLKLVSFPAIDRSASARPLWLQISASPDRVCVEDREIRRNWRYGLNYYSVRPLPDCATTPRPLHITQTDGDPIVKSAE